MLTKRLMLRVAGLPLLVGLLFLGSCLAAAAALHYQRSASAAALDAALQGHRVAVALRAELEALLARPGGPWGQGQAWPGQVGRLLDRARRLAGGPEEARQVARIEAGVGRSLQAHRAAAGVEAEAAASPGGTGAAARRVLEAEALTAAREWEQATAGRIARADRALGRTAVWVVWGLAGVSLVGTLTGLLLGYRATRGLGRAMLRAGELAELGQLAAGMAHELRNPLTSIKMLVQVDRERTEARGLPSDDLEAIEQEIRRMEARLNAFIDYARPPRPERRLIDLVSVVEQTFALIGGRAAKQRVALQFQRPATAVLIEADGEQVRQLLVNLALNALDVMPRGGILEVELRPPADGQVELRVQDTGPGIEPGHLTRLYEPFFTSKETGLGLGLAVSQRIARDHGGSLRAANRPEGGACFLLRLPAGEGGSRHE